MTSVPKPLKFLSELYKPLRDYYISLPQSDFKYELADLVSVIGMVASDEGTFESLKFCLQGTRKNLVEWGHEYLRSLAGEIGQEHNKRVENQENEDDL
jgi:26S proteasome regulatory subunit N1